MGGDGDTQLVLDKTTTQLKCLIEQLVNLVQHDDHVIQSDNDVAKLRQVSTTTSCSLCVCIVIMWSCTEWITWARWVAHSCQHHHQWYTATLQVTPPAALLIYNNHIQSDNLSSIANQLSIIYKHSYSVTQFISATVIIINIILSLSS